MSFSSEAGYIPYTFDQMVSFVREGVNAQFGTSYTEETFVGTNFYKYFYTLIQRLQENEVKTAEIFARLQEYFETTNEVLNRPNTTTPGIIDYFEDAGYLVSQKPVTEEEAGQLFLCVDVDDGAEDYAETKLEICNLIKDCVVAGVVTMGTESETLTLPNNQSFDFKFSLPDRVPILLRLTITQSENNLYPVQTTEWIKTRLKENIAAKYRLGMNFEPQRYFSVVDAPWAAEILLEYSLDDGDNWVSTVYDAEFDEVLDFADEDISIVES